MFSRIISFSVHNSCNQSRCAKNTGAVAKGWFYYGDIQPVVKNKMPQTFGTGGINTLNIANAPADDNNIGVNDVGHYRNGFSKKMMQSFHGFKSNGIITLASGLYDLFQG